MKKEQLSKKTCDAFLATIAEIKPWDSGHGEVIDTWYSKIDGSYICFVNNSQDISWMIEKGITTEIQSTRPGGWAAQIGFNPVEEKWYGWSHRAVFGFGIGQTVKKGDCGFSKAKGEWTAASFEDAKQMAIDFAESVS